MKLTRTQLYLGGLLLLQIAALVILRFGSPVASAGSTLRPLLPDFEPKTIERLAILSGTDSLELRREADGWAIDALDGFPADARKVASLIDALDNVRVGRPVVSSDRYHESFKVADGKFEVRLRAWNASDEIVADLLLGTSPNLRTSHVRLADRDPVYEAQGISTHDYRATAASWFDRQLVDESMLSVSGFSLTNAHGTLNAERVDGVWQTEDDARPLDQDRVQSLLRTATSLRIDQTAGRIDRERHGLENPSAMLRLRLGDQPEATREVTISIGATCDGDDASRYITRDGLGFSAIVKESSVSALLESLDREEDDD